MTLRVTLGPRSSILCGACCTYTTIFQRAGMGDLSQSSGHLGMEGNLGFHTVALVMRGFQVARIPATSRGPPLGPRGAIPSRASTSSSLRTAHNLESSSHATPRTSPLRSCLLIVASLPTLPRAVGELWVPPMTLQVTLGPRCSVPCGACCTYTTIFQRVGMGDLSQSLGHLGVEGNLGFHQHMLTYVDKCQHT